jgi:hypothetical protein
VWLDNPGFTGRVLVVEEVKDQIKPRVRPSQQEIKPIPVYRALLELRIDSGTPLGVHSLRLVSPRGVSNAIVFPVVGAPVAVESSSSHQTIEQSQEVVFPGFISGKIAAPAEVDFYAFDVKSAQEVRFEVTEGQRFDASADTGKFTAEVALYQAGGSWFDPQRPIRVLFEEERTSDQMLASPGGTYRFSKTGRYYLQVTGLFGQGCGDCTYQVRAFSVSPGRESTSQIQAVRSGWLERSLERRLTQSWIKDLEARSVKKPQAVALESFNGQTADPPAAAKPDTRAAGPLNDVEGIVEHEPNELPSKAESVSIPAVIEGTIERPGDLDSFKFSVEAGQKLAFEVEALDVTAPYFNPRIGVIDR